MEENEIKVVFLGSSGVGKTNLINRFISNKFNDIELATTAATYSQKNITYENKEYTFTIWDTTGAENFRPLTKLFLKNVQIFVLVYEISNKKSFLDLQYWLDYILEEYGSSTFNVLIGNKSDIVSDKKIKESEGAKFAEIIKAKFAHVSAKNNDNWSKIFEEILTDYIRIKKPKAKEQPGIYLDDYLLLE